MKSSEIDWLTLIVYFGLGVITVLFWSLAQRLGLLVVFLGISMLFCLILLINIDKWSMKGKD